MRGRKIHNISSVGREIKSSPFSAPPPSANSLPVSPFLMFLDLDFATPKQTWNWQSWFFWWGSIALFFVFISLYSLFLEYAYDFYYVAYQMMSRATFWLVMIQVHSTRRRFCCSVVAPVVVMVCGDWLHPLPVFFLLGGLRVESVPC